MKPTFYFLLAVLALALNAVAPLAQAQEPPKPETVRAEIGKPLQDAQELLKAKQYAEALTKLNSAEAVPDRTAFENFTIDRLRGAAAAGAGDLDLAAESFQRVIDSGRLSPTEQLGLMEGLTASYYNVKNYPKAIVWAKHYQKQGGVSDNLQTILIQSYYLSDDHAAAVAALRAQLKQDQQAGRTMTEIRMQMLVDSSLKLKDMPGYASALDMLVQAYPKPAYWTDLISRVSRQPGFSDRYLLDVLRLQRATDTLTTAADYALMAELALQLSLPAEALSVLDEGYAKSIFGAGPRAAHDDKLRAQARTQAATDHKILPDSEIAARKAATGIGLVNVGLNYFGQKQFEKAATLIEQGIAKGGLKRPDEAALHLGIALHWAGDKARAATVLKSVQGRDGGADLARLWTYVR